MRIVSNILSMPCIAVKVDKLFEKPLSTSPKHFQQKLDNVALTNLQVSTVYALIL